MATQSRLIKKYPNRRLYDTRTSTYITLADVKELVIHNEDFQVVEAKTGDDLTRSILLQIILEAEAGGAPMFTSDLLAQMIRFYGNAMQGMMGQYLESNIKAFADMQVQLKDQTKGLYGDGGTAGHDMWAQFMNFQGPAMQQMMGAYIEQSKKMVQQMQENVQEQTRKLFTGLHVPSDGPSAGKG